MRNKAWHWPKKRFGQEKTYLIQSAAIMQTLAYKPTPL